MISIDRFKANKSIDFPGWLKAREFGVTATQVARASTLSGFEETIQEIRFPREIADNDFMRFGRDQEGPIGLDLLKFGVLPNEWLISHEKNPRYLATPDGLSLDHDLISEIKTTGRDWGKSIPIQYRRQVQWQLNVTGAEKCVFAWMLRAKSVAGFVPGWIEPKTVIIERDEKIIADLSEVADRLLENMREGF
jgi:hypothetical protein